MAARTVHGVRGNVSGHFYDTFFRWHRQLVLSSKCHCRRYSSEEELIVTKAKNKPKHITYSRAPTILRAPCSCQLSIPLREGEYEKLTEANSTTISGIQESSRCTVTVEGSEAQDAKTLEGKRKHIVRVTGTVEQALEAEQSIQIVLRNIELDKRFESKRISREVLMQRSIGNSDSSQLKPFAEGEQTNIDHNDDPLRPTLRTYYWPQAVEPLIQTLLARHRGDDPTEYVNFATVQDLHNGELSVTLGGPKELIETTLYRRVTIESRKVLAARDEGSFILFCAVSAELAGSLAALCSQGRWSSLHRVSLRFDLDQYEPPPAGRWVELRGGQLDVIRAKADVDRLNHGFDGRPGASSSTTVAQLLALFRTTHVHFRELASVGQDWSSRFRNHMRNVPNPVFVATSASFKGSTSISHGLTISSLTTVTLSPLPVISFNVKIPSRSLDSIRARGIFILHMLAGNEEGALIANVLSKSQRASDNTIKIINQQGLRYIACYGGLRFQGPGVLAAFFCRVMFDKSPIVGDHMIVVAEVRGSVPEGQEEHIHEGPSSEDATPASLAYAQGLYRSIGPVIQPGRLKSSSTTGHSEPSFSASESATKAMGSSSSFDNRSSLKPFEQRAQYSTKSAARAIGLHTNFSPKCHISVYDLVQRRRIQSSAFQDTRTGADRFDAELANDQSSASQTPDHFDPQRPSSHGTQTPARAANRAVIVPRPEPTTAADLHSIPSLVLQQTVAEYLNVPLDPFSAPIPRRLRVRAAVKELALAGPKRVRAALAGGGVEARRAAGMRMDPYEMRLQKLVVQLHRAEKMGVVEENVIGRLIYGDQDQDQAKARTIDLDELDEEGYWGMWAMRKKTRERYDKGGWAERTAREPPADDGNRPGPGWFDGFAGNVR